ncbi:hypothetical protein K502DRAFT_368073 [Neoconidiobolus thromboides FSU 785]|nr:hypothetical protein K502DRAFT_368073 [Neoconidiobolus thromboides FSU 785]
MDINDRTVKIVEIIASIICVLSILFNCLSIYLVVSIKKTDKLNTGLGLILLVAFYDLVGPTVGLIQVIVIKATNSNFLNTSSLCQLVGIIESLVPFISTGAVALLSIERYLYIFQIVIPRFTMFLMIAGHFCLGLLLSSLASIGRDFRLATSRMICMVEPTSGVFGQIWFYSILFFLALHTIIIIFCYTKIILLRRVLSNSVQVPIEISTTNPKNNTIDSSQDFITNHFNKIRDSSSSGDVCPLTEEDKRFIKYKPDRFVIKAVLLMTSYLICVIPGLVVIIYHAVKVNIVGDPSPLSAAISATMFLPLFSISLINPILLISLHSKVSDRLSELISKVFGCFR